METGGPCGYNASRKIKSRKRQAMLDTDWKDAEAMLASATASLYAASVMFLTLCLERSS